jgi:hypothetical protein
MMTETLKHQILTIRGSGVTNMVDLTGVRRAAYERGFFELIEYLEHHRADYARFILTGKMDNDQA